MRVSEALIPFNCQTREKIQLKDGDEVLIMQLVAGG
jgi:sulfur carrier protein ThiS